ncbi:alanine racemase [Microtetraspora sp. NBRC 16547]|uniref:alanine racemase n=1 Tax=Microtetraspora sp. NBRC 16547 TaxID=3030993 RepID=UPI0024A5F717|nr:alanine racemase [Microtetraspora sp. NBRC 16547]GLX03021.1 amino acid deaminase [Microtetraspora sp. NBRC 16547]
MHIADDLGGLGGVAAGVLIDWSTRGFLHAGEPVTGREFVAAQHSLFDGSFTWPLMVVKRSALDHNIATLAAFTRSHGMAFAPHGKTTMAPAIFRAQLDAGAWGLSAATPGQALVYRNLGVPRVLLANEIVDTAALRRLADEVERGLEFLCYADSLEGVRILSDTAGAVPFRVLVELGHADGRTGCRSLAELLEVAEAVRRSPGVELAGVACYEGTRSGPDQVRGILHELRAAAEAVSPHVEGRLVVSAGGSAWFDLVAEELASLARPREESGLDALVLLRSGAYVAHDDGFYREVTPYNRIEGGLLPALEAWAQVLSVPEPGLALLGMGKRDVPYDIDLPMVRTVNGRTPGWLDEARVVKIQDQHTYLRFPPGEEGIRPGNLVSFGLSHPCSAFDKWRVIPLVDDDYVVIDLIKTYF